MNAKNRRLRTLIVLAAISSFVILLASSSAFAQGGPQSDELLISRPGAGPIFDNFIPEPAPPGFEPTLTFAGGPAPVPAPIPPAAAIGVPGASIIALIEPVGEPLQPGEVPIIILGPNGQQVVLSDVIISTLASPPAVAPPFITLVSDGSPDLAQIAPLLAGNPGVVYLLETGLLQDLTPFLPGTGPAGPFGLINVFVRSDIFVPEPSTLALAAFGFIGLAAWGWRRKR